MLSSASARHIASCRFAANLFTAASYPATCSFYTAAGRRRPFAPAAATGSAAPIAAAQRRSVSKMRDLSGFLQRVRECNDAADIMDTLVPFSVAGVTVGHLKPGFAAHLDAFPDVFQKSNVGGRPGLVLNPALADCETRSAAFAKVMEKLRDAGVIKGWRGELYPVGPDFYSPPLLLIERASAVYFGIRAYGVHVNGYVEQADGSILLWVGRRSASKSTWPSKLDHIVAGGQPFGISCADNVVKECGEEASIPEPLARAARPAGMITYMTNMEQGLKPDVLFCYDLKLPADFVPKPADGEVEEFMLWPLDKVADVIANTNEYKENCTLVIIDFMVRHGYITPEQPGYIQLVHGLRPVP